MTVKAPRPPPTFEIKVALLGAGSCGKTSLLRALLTDFQQPKIDDTPLLPQNLGEDGPLIFENDNDGLLSGNKSVHRFRIRSIGSVNSNGSRRRQDEKECVQVTSVGGIEVLEYQIEDTTFPLEFGKNNIDLVFEDIGGQCRGRSLQQYLQQTWKSIDCVIFVADLTRREYTAHDEDIFNLVDTHMGQTKEVPLLIFGNKFEQNNVVAG